MIGRQELDEELNQLQLQPPQWYWESYGKTYHVCIDSTATRRLLQDVANHVMALQRTGGDYSIPLILLAATMLQTGYLIGKRNAEAQILEGWMKL
jgi:hypothetical protein